VVLHHHREAPSTLTGCAAAGRRRSLRACHATAKKGHPRRDGEESWLPPLVGEGPPPLEPSRECGPRYRGGWGASTRAPPLQSPDVPRPPPLCAPDLESATKRGTPQGLHPSGPMLPSASAAAREIQQQRCGWVERGRRRRGS
jgi:hypothetical protein